MALVEATVCQKLEGMYCSRAQLTRKARAQDRDVLIFTLLDHPHKRCCYVWEEHGRVRTVLAEDPRADVGAAIEAHDGNGAPK